MGGVAKKKVETREQLSTTFSKRRKGLFTKTVELSLFCDARLVVLVEPIHQKKRKRKEFYCLEHPSFDAVYECFLSGGVPPDINIETKNIMMSLYEERKILDRKMAGTKRGGVYWWQVEDFNKYQSIEEFELVVSRMQSLKKGVETKLNISNPPENATTKHGGNIG
ncbi:SRF-TF domain-containing protein [Cephalotus follicularis]|uniref:SRF-TF domain-containing protein n=1 Tax=Cephalotus follicularis TaxID=3775 RepID=A0A1Q3CDB8_CEPFO|nr:SRF-TF domain-containing protein [Cephalotus follicularis]